MVDLLDSAVLSRLVDIMRTSSADLQRKSASILEFAAVIESCTEKILSVDLESGLDAVFQQKTLNGMRDYFPAILIKAQSVRKCGFTFPFLVGFLILL